MFKIHLHALTFGGEAVGSIEGLTVFVPFGVPGDTVEIEIVERKKNFARARISNIVQPSPNRLVPICPLFGMCGGCQWLNVDYSFQLEWKKEIVRQSLRRIGKLDSVDVRPVIGMTDPFHYRHKVRYSLAFDGKQLITGYNHWKTHNVINIGSCPLHHLLLDKALKSVSELLKEHSKTPGDLRQLREELAFLIARVSSTGLVIVTIVSKNKLLIENECKLLLDKFPWLLGIVCRKDHFADSKKHFIIGVDFLLEEICGIKFKVSDASFFQINPSQASILLDTVRDFANASPGSTVIDLFSGVGFFSLALARSTKEVWAIERGALAVEDAKANAQFNDIKNVHFLKGDAAFILPKCGTPDIVVVDPPREGCSQEVIERLATNPPTRIIYVSCDPACLARDLGKLSQKGYEVVCVQPIDMFPHTYHVESVALLIRRR